jgi:hypothetical protein
MDTKGIIHGPLKAIWWNSSYGLGKTTQHLSQGTLFPTEIRTAIFQRLCLECHIVTPDVSTFKTTVETFFFKTYTLAKHIKILTSKKATGTEDNCKEHVTIS